MAMEKELSSSVSRLTVQPTHDHSHTTYSTLNAPSKQGQAHVTQRYKQPHKRQQPRRQPCRNCGNAWPQPNGRASCPAFGKECRKCKKKNHFAQFCRGGNQDSVNMASVGIDQKIPPLVAEDSDDAYVYALNVAK